MPTRQPKTADAYAAALELCNAAGDRESLLAALLSRLRTACGAEALVFFGHQAWQHALVAEAASGPAPAYDPARVVVELARAPCRSATARLAPGAPPAPVFLLEVAAGGRRFGALAASFAAGARSVPVAAAALLERVAPQLGCALARLGGAEAAATELLRLRARADAATGLPTAGVADAPPPAERARRQRLAHDLRAPLNIVIGYTEVLEGGLLGALNPQQQEAAANVRVGARELLARLDALLPELFPEIVGGDAVAAIARLPAVRPQHDGPRRALVVEDDPAAARLMRELLEAEGLVVRVAASADAAWQALADEIPDLVTLDVLLPGRDGWSLLAQLRAAPALAGVPVIVASILDEDERGFHLGATRVMQKPIARRDIVAALGQLGLVPANATNAAADARMRVLVVDDDPRAVEIIAAYLEAAGCEALRAYGGRAGIELARSARPAAIVLDLLMPEVSGFDVVAALRSDPETAAIPVLIVTAKYLTAEERERLDGQVLAVIEKSRFDRAGFVAEVRRLLGTKPNE